jgi:hypothetical protein
MLGAIGLIGISLSAALARAADRMPDRVALIEGCGGVLLIAGLAILGCGLPFV